MPGYSVLAFWNVIDNGVELRQIVVALPIFITGLQFELTYIGLILKNHSITETLKRLQNVIDRRE